MLPPWGRALHVYMARNIPWLGLHGWVEQPGCHISYLQGKDPINPNY
jgi:hypothetical protein